MGLGVYNIPFLGCQGTISRSIGDQMSGPHGVIMDGWNCVFECS